MSGKTLTDHKMGCEVMVKKIKKMFDTPVSVSVRGIRSLLPKKRSLKKENNLFFNKANHKFV